MGIHGKQRLVIAIMDVVVRFVDVDLKHRFKNNLFIFILSNYLLMP